MASRAGLLSIILALCLLGVWSQSSRSKDEKYKVLKGEWCGPDNCYELLGVSPDVEFRDIKSKYNNLSLSLHPDKNPNQSDADRELYVRINKAYEILSSKRNDYDEYLRIKVSMDSPVESPLVVLFVLYLGIAGVVLFYQRQTQKKVKDAILKNNEVIRYYWDKKGIDLTGKRKDKKSPRGRGKKKKKQSSNRCPEEFKASIEVDEINEVLTALNMHVAEWKKEEPTYKRALWIVATSLGWAMTELLFRMRWTLKYQLLGQELSDDDREHLCMKHFNISDDEWEAMSQQDRKELLNKKGKWRKKGDKKRN